MASEASRLAQLRDQLWQGLLDKIPGIEMNGHSTIRLPHNLSVAIPSVESRLVLMRLKNDVAISTGSACTTAQVEPSHVIQALNLDDKRAYHSIRLGLGTENNDADVAFVINKLTQATK